jgi:hypothetical protein
MDDRATPAGRGRSFSGYCGARLSRRVASSIDPAERRLAAEQDALFASAVRSISTEGTSRGVQADELRSSTAL